MKITLTLTKDEILEKFASEFGLSKDSINLEIVDGNVIEANVEEQPKQIAEDDAAQKERFLKSYLAKNKMNAADAAKATDLSTATINRACRGYSVNSTTFGKLVRGLCMDDDEIRMLKKSLTRHQL